MDVSTGPVTDALHRVLAEVSPNTAGELATHIPELADEDPDRLAVALASTEGRCYHAGDAGHRFTLQSLSKPFVYALALTDRDVDEVHEHVGFEPSGEPFNSISLDAAGRPDNPMINAGAIVTSSLVRATDAIERSARILEILSAFAGRDLEMDEKVYASEQDNGDRNHALAHLARASGVLASGVDEAVDAYFRQCSILVDTRDLAVMAATLADEGINPMTGRRVVSEVCARHTLSLMVSCGMYDGAGEWMMRVGIPAKSGVSGGIVAVKPGQFGIGVFSPRLDEKGNSARGVEVLQELSDAYGLHLLRRPTAPAGPLVEEDADSGAHVLRPRGELDFVEVEAVVHDLWSRTTEEGEAQLSLDLSAVTALSVVAHDLLQEALRHLRDAGRAIEVLDPGGVLGDDEE